MTTDPLVVQTPSGAVRGVRREGSLAFLGVPYAEPPVGDLRFAAPVPRAPWDGVRDAVVYGPTPQRKALAEITAIPEPSIPGEDTLTLNVFTPDTAPAEPLPVLVWIHGGGFVAGSPASPWYDGAAFNRDGVVVVVIAYRLGFDGFGVLPDAPHNRGVLDQLLALAWVRDTIGAFGGDPARVTIAGQSAGGGAVATLLASPAAKGLFSAVASISGSPADLPLEEARRTTEALAARLGVPATVAGFRSVPEEVLVREQGGGFADLDDPGAEQLVEVARGLAGDRPFGPVVDGAVVTRPIEAALAAGAGADVPLLLGATADEFSGVFGLFAERLDPQGAADLLAGAGLDGRALDRYLAALPGRSPSGILGRWVTDTVFRRYVVRWRAARAGAAAGTWAYDFTWRGAQGISEHCLDVPFWFDVLHDDAVERLTGPNPPQALADAMHGALVAFVRQHDPGWAQEEVHVFDVPDGADPGAYSSAELLAR